MAIVDCERSTSHQYSGHLGTCPFCEREGVVTSSQVTPLNGGTLGPAGKLNLSRLSKVLIGGLVGIVAVYAFSGSDFITFRDLDAPWGEEAAQQESPWSKVAVGDCFSNYGPDIPLIDRNQVPLDRVDCAAPDARLMAAQISDREAVCTNVGLRCLVAKIDDAEYISFEVSPIVGDCLHGGENIRYPELGHVAYGVQDARFYDCSVEASPVTPELAKAFGGAVSENSLAPRKFRLNAVKEGAGQCAQSEVSWRVTVRPEDENQSAVYTYYCTTVI